MNSQTQAPLKSPSSPGRGTLSFRARLVLGVCGLVLLTGVTVLWLAQRSARSSTETFTSAVFREVSARAVTHTQSFVFRAAPVVESLVQLADKGLAIGEPERLVHQLLAVLRANPGLSWVSFGDEEGTFSGATRMPDGGLRLNRSHIVDGKTKLIEHDVLADGSLRVFRTDDDSGYDPRVRPYYLQAKKAGRTVWSPPYVFYYREVPGISCTAPVKDAGGRLLGVLSVDFDLNALSDFVGSLAVSEHSRVFLFTADEVLLAHPAKRVVAGSTEPGQGRLLTLGDAGDPLVDDYRASLRTIALTAEKEPRFHRFEFLHEGVEQLGSVTAFRVGDEMTWAVGVIAARADFVGDVWRTQAIALGAAAAAVLAAVGLAFALASTVSRPVRALIGFMQRVGGGDLEAKAEFGGSGEFRQLADALNRMIGDLRDRLRLRHSLGVAMEVQQRLLPAAPPQVRGLDVAGHSTYCDETGGDYYDFLVLDQAAPDVVLVALGDVMGHGVAAALVMAGVRAVLRDRVPPDVDLAELMGRLNGLICADHGGKRFMTMHLSVIDSKAATMRWVSAGHDPVLVFDPVLQSFAEDNEGDMPLGVMGSAEFGEHVTGVKSGQILFIGTDGVWEMPNAAGELFGKERLREVIRAAGGSSADEIAAAVRSALTAFRGDAKAVDDVTFVVVKVS